MEILDTLLNKLHPAFRPLLPALAATVASSKGWRVLGIQGRKRQCTWTWADTLEVAPRGDKGGAVRLTIILQSSYPPALPDLLWQKGYDAAREAANSVAVCEAYEAWSLNDPQSLRRLLDATLFGAPEHVNLADTGPSVDQDTVAATSVADAAADQDIIMMATSSQDTQVDQDRIEASPLQPQVVLPSAATGEGLGQIVDVGKSDVVTKELDTTAVDKNRFDLAANLADKGGADDVVHMGSPGGFLASSERASPIRGDDKATELEKLSMDATKIKFDQKNPKKGKCAERYDKYKKAVTIGEAKKKGATPRDIKNDYEHGFFSLTVASAELKRQQPLRLDESPDEGVKNKKKRKAAVFESPPHTVVVEDIS